MRESPFLTVAELEARRTLHEAIGRFVVAFELVVAELRSACRLILERSGLGIKNQPLANIVLARVGAKDLTDLVGAMYREFRPDDHRGVKALDAVLQRIDTLRGDRNKIIHAAWTLGLPDEQGSIIHVAHSVSFARIRKKGQQVRQMELQPADFDDLTAEATKLQVYGMRLCHSVNQPNLPLADQLSKAL